MILSFDELGIIVSEYNSYSAENATVDIINRAADYIKMQWTIRNVPELAGVNYIETEFYLRCDFDIFRHFDWPIDFVAHTITIPGDVFFN